MGNCTQVAPEQSSESAKQPTNNQLTQHSSGLGGASALLSELSGSSRPTCRLTLLLGFTMIGFSTSNLDTDRPSYFWRLIVSGKYEIAMARNGLVIGPELVVMEDQEKAADIADIVQNIIVVYDKSGGNWKQRKT